MESRIVMDGCETINCFYQTENGELFVCSDTGVALIDKGADVRVSIPIILIVPLTIC